METKILNANNLKHIELCAQTIREGGLVAIPTETVYGLAANALNEMAVANIFSIKGRQSDNPLIVHISSTSNVPELVDSIPTIFEPLAKKFWPGPLTMVMRKSNKIPDNVSAGLDTVALRIPNHPAALKLIHTSGCPIAAPSANLSGSPSPTKAIHVKNDIDGKIPYILDGGNCSVGLESTVLDISCDIPTILRPGGITFDEIKSVIGNVIVAFDTDNDKPRSPGMKYRHYAPKAPLTAISGPAELTAQYIKNNLDNDMAALMFDDYGLDHPNIITFGDSHDFTAQAANLFDALRRADKIGVVKILAQLPSEKDLGLAVANRIRKASGNNIIYLIDSDIFTKKRKEGNNGL